MAFLSVATPDSAVAGSAPAPAAAPAAPAALTPPATAASTPTGARTWVLDAKKSQFVLQVFKAGAASALAHDHTVHATEFSGEVVADPASPTTARVAITVKATSLVNDDPVVRQKYRLDPNIPDKDRTTVQETMLGEDQLDVARFPTIAFASTAVEKSGDKLTLVGDFTLKGVTKQVKMPIAVTIDGNTLTGDATLRFKQSDWGMKPYSAFLGAVKNKDEVILNIHLVGRSAS